ncbi:MAG: hypothetical protein KAR05_09875 [Candidatus Omnitrophica bacterium]|nr:hypothetical protein [Candidatus Omnitrophota bacterium]
MGFDAISERDRRWLIKRRGKGQKFLAVFSMIFMLIGILAFTKTLLQGTLSEQLSDKAIAVLMIIVSSSLLGAKWEANRFFKIIDQLKQ